MYSPCRFALDVFFLLILVGGGGIALSCFNPSNIVVLPGNIFQIALV